MEWEQDDMGMELWQVHVKWEEVVWEGLELRSETCSGRYGNKTSGMELKTWECDIGYDSMGYELSKPKLRAELELDLKRYYSLCHPLVYPPLYVSIAGYVKGKRQRKVGVM